MKKEIKIIMLALATAPFATPSQTPVIEGGAWAADVQRYYSNPYDPESYIDLNKNIANNNSTYDVHNQQFTPDTTKETVPAHNQNQPQIIYFQPSDGSMTNGTYNPNSKTAQTALYTYNKVLEVDGTLQSPHLTKEGKYKDSQGNLLEQIGTVKVPVPDSSPSDIKTYYLFAQSSKKIMPPAGNKPTQDYNSQGE